MFYHVFLAKQKEFDRKFEGYWRGQAIPDEIKFFQKSTTLAYIDSMIQKLEGKKKECLEIDNCIENDLPSCGNCKYNQCLDEQIAELKDERRLIENE